MTGYDGRKITNANFFLEKSPGYKKKTGGKATIEKGGDVVLIFKGRGGR